MDYRYLPAFLAVARTHSFTEAALQLRIAQSAVSRQIRLLEESLKTQLFLRSKQKVVLTPSGLELFEQSHRFDSWFAKEFRQTIPVVRMAALPGVLEGWLTERLACLSLSDVPNFELRALQEDEIESEMMAGRLDFALSTRLIDNEAVTSRKVFQEDFALISKRPIDLKNLQNYTWISSGRSSYLNRLSKKRPQKTIVTDSLTSIQKLVAAGLGIAILPTHVIAPHLGLTVHRKTSIAPGYIYLTTPNYRILPLHLKEILKLLDSP